MVERRQERQAATASQNVETNDALVPPPGLDAPPSLPNPYVRAHDWIDRLQNVPPVQAAEVQEIA
jgi:hypothetical protein